MKTKHAMLVLLLSATTANLNNYVLPERPPPPDRWWALIKALIQVESEGDSLVVNHLGATGWLQIMPIYVKDVNRIIGSDKYTIEHAKSGKLSIEMFNIYQSYYNPTRNIARAIHLHNPKANNKYKTKVWKQFQIVLLENSIPVMTPQR